MVIRSWFFCVLLGALPSAALAQEAQTRAEEQANEQREKAGRVAPYARNFFEKKLLEYEHAGGLTLIRGWYLTFGDIKQGSGFAVGPAYSKLFDNGTAVIGKVTYSLNNFKLAQIALASAPLAGGKVVLSGRMRWQDAPALAVFALGPDSPTVRADYAETKTEASGQAAFRPARLLRFGAGGAFERYETGPANTRRSSMEELYSPAQLPGLNADPSYLHTFVLAAIDSRAGLTYSRSGSLLEAALHDYRQQNTGPYSFQRVDAVARQLVPLFHGNNVFDLSVRTSTTTVDEGKQVPFFLMPDLGGTGELRGYQSYRFRDRNSILFTAEYRWYVQEFVDMALFYDAGKVAARRADLDFDDLRSNIGIGIRFHGPRTTALRIEVAKGDEGMRFIFGFSGVR